MPDSQERSRFVELSGQSNFRDLGGHPSRDGRRVRWGELYRSGELSELSDDDVDKLAALGIRTVIDLRSQREVESKGPDRVPPGASVVSLSIDPGDLTPMVGPGFATGDFSTVPVDLLDQINREYIRDWKHQLAALLRVVADPANRPVVFHCTQGKDRAGISAAMVLSALDVSWEGVVEDYLLSNVQRRELAEAGLNQLRRKAARQRGIDPEDVDLSNIRGLFFVDASYLGAARDEIAMLFGSVESFLFEGIGCSESMRSKLQQDLLE
jgi:protein-tyrosine phosphatase